MHGKVSNYYRHRGPRPVIIQTCLLPKPNGHLSNNFWRLNKPNLYNHQRIIFLQDCCEYKNRNPVNSGASDKIRADIVKMSIPASHFLLSSLYSDAERPIFRSHAEHGNERIHAKRRNKELPISVPPCFCGFNVSC